MKRITIAACIVALGVGSASFDSLALSLSKGEFAQYKADDKKASVLLQAAEAKATVHGDLKAAIALYGDAVTEAGTNRALAAKALVRMAECYQKLGDTEAQRIYERVIREFIDQRDAVAFARARLGAPGPTRASSGDRPVWTGPNVDLFGTVSPDGRVVSYVDWGGAGNLMLHDLSAGTDRPLTKNVSYGQFGQALFSTISKDGKQVAFGWDTNDGVSELRVARLDGGGIPDSRRVFASEEAALRPYDWSSDGQWVGVHVQRKDQTGQIALVRVADGTLRGLKSVGWRAPGRIVFSPDSRFIAYDLSVSDSTDESHIFVLAIDGSREAEVVADRSANVMMGWSPDGGQLLFASNRTASTALWAVHVSDGKAAGSPVVVKTDIGSTWSLGMTAAGSLYVYKEKNTQYVRVTSIDMNQGKLLPAAGGEFRRFVGSGGSPAWSPDGTLLAYRTCSAPGLPCRIAIASVESGQVRELRPALAYLNDVKWSKDSRSVKVYGRDLKGRRGIYRVDIQSAAVSPLMEQLQLATWNSTESKVYYRINDRRPAAAGGGPRIVERDLSSGAEREMFRHSGDGGGVSLTVSPDDRFLGIVDGGSNTQTLLLVPVAGGAPRELYRAKLPEAGLDGFRMVWTPDSRGLILPKLLGANGERKEMWLVPVDGGQPRKLDIDANNWILPGGGFQLHPDGRRIAFIADDAAQSGPEVWALENVLPAVKIKK